VVSFPVAFSYFHVQTSIDTVHTLLNHVQTLTHVFQKMLQESWLPARAVFRGYIHCIYRKANSCTIALSIPITKGVQARTNGIHQGNASDRERNCRFMVWDRMNWDEQCSDKYIHCTYIVHTLYKHVHEIHVFVHTCLELVHKMYILGTYIECTSSCLYVQRKMQKAKICRWWVSNPTPRA
jgi:hypothetical protein